MTTNKLWFIIILFLGFIHCKGEEDFEPAHADGFVKIITGDFIDRAEQIKALPDGYIVLGNASSPDMSRARISRLDKQGNTLWTSYFPSATSESTFRYEAKALTAIDNGYIVIGDSINKNTNMRSMYLYKVNAESGGEDNSISSSERGITTAEKLAKDGSALLDGIPGQYRGVDVFSTNGSIITLTGFTPADGTANNYTLISERNSSDLSYKCSRTPISNANFTLFGSLYFNPSVSSEVYFGRVQAVAGVIASNFTKATICDDTNSGGNSSLTVGEEGNFIAKQAIPVGNSFAVVGTHSITGSPDTDIFVMRTDKYGNGIGNPILFSNELVDPFGNKLPISGTEEGNSIAYTNDGGFIITGSTRNKNNERNEIDILLLKIDALGKVQWFKTFGDTNEEQGIYVEQAYDGGFAVLANVEFGNIEMMALIKTDANGNLD